MVRDQLRIFNRCAGYVDVSRGQQDDRLVRPVATPCEATANRMIAVELILQHLGKLCRVQMRKGIAIVACSMNDRLEAAFHDRQSRAEEYLQSRGERMRTTCVQLAIRV